MNGKGEAFSFGMNIEGKYFFLAYLKPLTIHSWAHMCYALDLAGGKVDLAVNGKLIGEHIEIQALKGIQNITVNKIRLGSSTVGGHLSYIGNLNVHKAQNTSKELVALTTQSCEEKGDILAWADVAYDITGNGYKQEVEIALLCWPLDKVVVNVVAKVTWDTANNICYKMGKSGLFPPQKKHWTTREAFTKKPRK